MADRGTQGEYLDSRPPSAVEFWLNLQSLYELRLAQKKAGKSISRLPTLKHFEEAHA